jgi:hypothetical protein
VSDEGPGARVVVDGDDLGQSVVDGSGGLVVGAGDDGAARRLDARRGQVGRLRRRLSRREDGLWNAASRLACGVEASRLRRRVAA